jgi:hypothetical protein
MQLSRVLAAGLLCVYFAVLWREVMGPSQVAVTVELGAAAAERTDERPGRAPPAEPVVNVIDVAAAAATPSLVLQLLRLAPHEQIASIDDQRVAGSSAEPWLRLAARFAGTGPRPPIAGGDYLDFTIRAPDRSRRVLVLFH